NSPARAGSTLFAKSPIKVAEFSVMKEQRLIGSSRTCHFQARISTSPTINAVYGTRYQAFMDWVWRQASPKSTLRAESQKKKALMRIPSQTLRFKVGPLARNKTIGTLVFLEMIQAARLGYSATACCP